MIFTLRDMWRGENFKQYNPKGGEDATKITSLPWRIVSSPMVEVYLQLILGRPSRHS